MKESIKARAERLVCDKGHLIHLEQEGFNWRWFVPSQSELGKFYKIPFLGDDCQCTYHVMTGATCTHMVAAQIVRVKRARWEHERRRREGLQDLRPQTKRELAAIAERFGV